MTSFFRHLAFALGLATALGGVALDADACTQAFVNQFPGYRVSARNLDYFGPVDPSLVISPRGVARHGGEDAKAATWTSRYGSVAVYADGVFPMDGMNEKGLAGHTLFFTEGSQVQSAHPDRPVVESKAWLSYILDNFATVDEAVKAINDDVRLVARQLPIDYASNAKHIALEDASGDAAVIEIVDGVVHIYHGRDMRVMTNPPSYDKMLKELAQYKNATREQIPGGLDADQRLVRANFDLEHLPQPDNKAQAQGFALAVINNVAYPIGEPALPDEQAVIDTYAKFTPAAQQRDNKGVATYWQTISDLSHGEYHFKSVFAPSEVWVSLKEIDFAKGQPVRRIDHLNDYAQHGWEGNILSHAKA